MRHVFIYDLGGGTFDTTVIRVDGDDIQVICTDGNRIWGASTGTARSSISCLSGFTEQYPQLIWAATSSSCRIWRPPPSS